VLFCFCQERTDYVLAEGPVKWTSQIRKVAMFVTADFETILCEYVIFIIHLRKKLHTTSLHATTKPTVNKHTHMTAILYSRNITKQKFHAFTIPITTNRIWTAD